MQKCRKKIYENYRKKTATNKKINLNQYNNIKATTTTLPHLCHQRTPDDTDRTLANFPDYGRFTIFNDAKILNQ